MLPVCNCTVDCQIHHFVDATFLDFVYSDLPVQSQGFCNDALMSEDVMNWLNWPYCAEFRVYISSGASLILPYNKVIRFSSKKKKLFYNASLCKMACLKSCVLKVPFLPSPSVLIGQNTVATLFPAPHATSINCSSITPQ